MASTDSPSRRPRNPEPADEEENWDEQEERDKRPPLKLERRRHRDPEEVDERRESERRRHPRERGPKVERDR